MMFKKRGVSIPGAWIEQHQMKDVSKHRVKLTKTEISRDWPVSLHMHTQAKKAQQCGGFAQPVVVRCFRQSQKASNGSDRRISANLVACSD